MSKHGISNLLSTMDHISKEKDGLTFGEILDLLGERSHACLVLLLCLPFLQPVPMMGLSSIFGSAIMLAGLGLLLKRPMYLPERIRKQYVPKNTLNGVLKGGRAVFAKLEKFIKPRASLWHGAPWAQRLSGLCILICAFLLALPLPIPGSNMTPSVALLFLSLGLLEKDGYLVLMGYVMTVLNIVGFTLLAVLPWLGWQYFKNQNP